MASCVDTGPKWNYEERIMTTDFAPYGIAWYGGELVVTDPERSLMAFVGKDRMIERPIKDFNEPRRLNVVEDKVIVAEAGTNRIGLWTKDNTHYYPLVEQPDNPMAATMGKSKIAVADYNNHKVIYFKSSENLSFGEHGIEDGQFKYPTDIQIFANKIYVADNVNRRVQVFDVDGKFLKSIGEGTDIQQASGVYVYNGGVILCDRKGSQVFWFDHNGALLQEMKEGFESPSDAVVVGKTLYIADEAGGFIAVLNME